MMSLSAVQTGRRTTSIEKSRMLDSSFVLMSLILLVFISAFSLIYIKYESQQLYMAYNNLKTEELKLEQEQDKLALEKATLGSHARIYSYAKETSMHVPTRKEIVILS
jgi:cell division protein FtsL